jgi:hypothetical protein
VVNGDVQGGPHSLSESRNHFGNWSYLHIEQMRYGRLQALGSRILNPSAFRDLMTGHITDLETHDQIALGVQN